MSPTGIWFRVSDLDREVSACAGPDREPILPQGMAAGRLFFENTGVADVTTVLAETLRSEGLKHTEQSIQD